MDIELQIKEEKEKLPYRLLILFLDAEFWVVIDTHFILQCQVIQSF